MSPDALVAPEEHLEFVEDRALIVGDEHVDRAAPAAPARTGARVSDRHPFAVRSVSLNGCDFGMRMRTIVPAPGLVSMTSAWSSP